jgi:hypothetical protein
MCIINNIHETVGCVIDKNRFKSKYVVDSGVRYINFIFHPLPINQKDFQKIINTIRFQFSPYVLYVDDIITGELFNVYLRDECYIRKIKIEKLLKNISN